MESSRIKRRRLILVSSNVSSQWPDIPARFESLNDDTLTTVLEFVGDNSYRSFGGLNKYCKEVYLNTPGMTKETFLYGYAPLSAIIDKIEKAGDQVYSMWYKRVGKGVVYYNRRDVMDWALQQRNKCVLHFICEFAAEEGKTDLLDEVWNNLDDVCDKENIFSDVDDYAARYGKLEVLKWLEDKGKDINKDWCAVAAAEYGHLHILQWLQDEKGLQLTEDLYGEVIWSSGHLHVLKWLREQGYPWDKDTFACAAERGNLDILQFLHDQSCPWPREDSYRDYRVSEEELTPEVIDWLHSHGYGNRLIIF